MVREVETDPPTERALEWLAALNGMTVERVLAEWVEATVRAYTFRSSTAATIYRMVDN